MRDEEDARIVGNASTLGTEAGGRRAMEALMRKEAGIDVVYAINEPAAAGAHAVLRALGVEKDVLIVSVDGGCAGVRNVAAGRIGATAMQYPVRMASLGIEAVVEFHRTGRKPENPPGMDFHDTGVTLVTDKPVPGVPSISTEQGLGSVGDESFGASGAGLFPTPAPFFDACWYGEMIGSGQWSCEERTRTHCGDVGGVS